MLFADKMKKDQNNPGATLHFLPGPGGLIGPRSGLNGKGWRARFSYCMITSHGSCLLTLTEYIRSIQNALGENKKITGRGKQCVVI